MLSFQWLKYTPGFHMPLRILKSEMCKSNSTMKNESGSLSPAPKITLWDLIKEHTHLKTCGIQSFIKF